MVWVIVKPEYRLIAHNDAEFMINYRSGQDSNCSSALSAELLNLLALSILSKLVMNFAAFPFCFCSKKILSFFVS